MKSIASPAAKQPIARLDRVSLLRENRWALSRLEFEVKPGEHWALLGPNGSGKSSLLGVLQGWLWPQEGSVEVLGQSFGLDDLSLLRRHIGWVGGEIESEFPRWQSVLDIVLSGGVGTIGLQFDKPTAAMKRFALERLRWVGLSGLESRPCRHLSQGQTRLLTIARALMTAPRLLILDEPCTGLDPVAREKFLRRLSRLLRLKNGPSAFFVTHHVEEIVPEISHVLLLKEGRQIAAGPIGTTLTGANLRKTFGAAMQIVRTEKRYALKWK
jgi:iron complex transport system ATP-binding protein